MSQTNVVTVDTTLVIRTTLVAVPTPLLSFLLSETHKSVTCSLYLFFFSTAVDGKFRM